MDKLQIVDSLLEDGSSDYVAMKLKESYNDLKESLEHIQHGGNSNGIFSFDNKEEAKQIKKYMKGLKRSYEWFGVGDIDG
jgi:hypothetical protein